jgi:hypothetical protein
MNSLYGGAMLEPLPVGEFSWLTDEEISQLDITKNSLYGGAMLEPLPVGEFSWLTDEEISQLDITKINKKSDIGYILEVTLSYPDILHDHHSDLPLPPESTSILVNDLSPYCRDQFQKINNKRKGVV